VGLRAVVAVVGVAAVGQVVVVGVGPGLDAVGALGAREAVEIVVDEAL
jgi:hypothetical protein